MWPCCACSVRWQSRRRPPSEPTCYSSSACWRPCRIRRAAAGHLTEALATTASWPRRGEIALALAEALALGGQFAAAVDLLAMPSAEAADERSREACRPRCSTPLAWISAPGRPPGRCWSGCRRGQRGGEHLEPQLAANLAIELAAAGQDRDARDAQRTGGAYGDTAADVGQRRRAPGDDLGPAVR